MPPLTFDERLSVIGAGAIMGLAQTIWTKDVDLAKKIRRRLQALKLPPAARRRIKVRAWRGQPAITDWTGGFVVQ